jgi:hypothetical protein
MQWWMRPGPSRPCAISKPRPFAEQHVGGRDAHILELDLHMAVRRIVIAVDGERALDRDAGRVERDQHHRLLLVLSRARVGLAHHDRDLAARIACAARPPFPPVQHVLVTVSGNLALDVGRVGRGDARFGHQKGGADLAVHQRPQPLLLLLAGAVAVEHLHVAGVGRRAVEHLARPGNAAHFLGAERIFEVGELRPLERERLVDMAQRRTRRHEQVPQPRRLGLGLELLDHLDRLPPVPGRDLLLVVAVTGPDMSLDEVANPVAVMALTFRKGKVHRAPLAWLNVPVNL